MSTTKFKIIYIGRFNWEIRTDNGIHLTGPQMCYTIEEVAEWATGFCSSWNSPFFELIGEDEFTKDLKERK